MKKYQDLCEHSFNKAIEEKMNYYPGTDEFKTIINNYRIENKRKNALMKDVYESVYSKDIKLILKQRNKNVKKTEMEEDEAEKLTNFKLATNKPQKLSTLISSIAEKKKNKEKRDEEENKKRRDPDNKFGTQIKRNKSPPMKKSLLETIYENKKPDMNNNANDDQNANENNNNIRRKYQKRFQEKNISLLSDSNINTNTGTYSSGSKNNTPEKDYDKEDNEEKEINIFKNRQRLISGVSMNMNNVSHSLNTAADSRLYSGKSSNYLDNSNYISILHNPDISDGKKKIFFFKKTISLICLKFLKIF